MKNLWVMKMNEAPKKIWVSEYAIEKHVLAHELNGEIKYIRADLVSGLVEALEEATRVSNMGHLALEKARTALKTLEEE